ncbi:MAG: phosphoenolpyruvate--protein phosphotransferase, partial [Proteobacteria bacterium]|nr:phosphoenolpyruvate--protein phosphotransferase [Pseudomonadota bacterium]
MKNELVLTGFGVSHGIAMGLAYLVQIEHPTVPEYTLPPEQVPAEIDRFIHAVAQARNELITMKVRSLELPEVAAEEISLLLEAHLAMLSGSRLVRGVLQRIEKGHVNAERAIEQETHVITEQFRQLQDPYIAARSEDVAAVGYRLIRILMNVPYLSLSAVPTGGIVLAQEVSPAEIALLDPRKFSGIATVHGGITGHTAVMARSMGLPAVLGVNPSLLDSAHHGCLAIVDGIDGKIVLNPTPTTQKRYEQKLLQLRRDQKELKKLATLPAMTLDNTAITLSANLEMPRDLDDILASGAQGIGLFRTEFMFMNRDTLPTEDEQFEAIVEVVRAMKGAPVTFRTLDIGGDKMAKWVGAYLSEAANPALGLRAIRLSLKELHLLRAQFRAVLRAGYFGPVRLLLPMVTMASEVERARKTLKECYVELQKEKVPVSANLPPL